MLRSGALWLRRAATLQKRAVPVCTSVKSYSDQASAGVPYEAYTADESSLTASAPETADVVVVGGGVIGCATLYHLAKLGVTNAVLVEKDQLTAGTTWHTAGLVWRLRPNDVDIQVLARSHELMTTLEEETGVHTGWINNGGLFIASNKERLDEYKRLQSIGKVFGIESHILGPKETKELYPLLNVNDIYGTLYSPLDGTIDPAGYCTALVRGATRNGAKVLQNCAVTGIDVAKDDFGLPRVKSVHTARGTIKTKCVINCAGVWANELGAMAGVKVPLVAMKHAYVVTERIEGIQNMPNVRDHDLSLYLKLQGDTLQVGGYEPNPIFTDSVPRDFAFSLYELDWDVFSVHVEGAVHRLPKIETTGIRSTVCGPESFTPDHKPLMGESPEVRGFYFGCGFNSLGMSLSGCAEQLAKWVINGRPDWDMFGYDIRRFAHRLTDNTKWVLERSHEAYAKNYSIVFIHDEPLASRNQSCDALHGTLLDAGCVFQERQGWERPGWFSSDPANSPLPYDYYGSYDHAPNTQHKYNDKLVMDYTFDFPEHHSVIGNECMACRNNVAVFDMSYFGKYYVSGPDAQAAVDWLFTNDMQKGAGSTMYTCMLNARGGTELDLTVSVLDSGSGAPHAPDFKGGVGFYLAVGGGASQHGYSYVQSVIQDKQFNCSILDHSHDMCLISVQGPHSRDLLQSLTTTDLSNDKFPFSTHQVVDIAGHECRALRLSFVGELGWELHVPNTAAVEVYKAVMEAGKQYGVVNAGYRAIDSLSIEKGYRHWHGDLRSDDTPLESMLGFTCRALDGSKGDYLGRSALQQQKAEGLGKRIVCFTLDDHVALHGLEAIWRNDELVGFVRRAEFAFYLNKSIAYGYVSRPDKQPITADYLKQGTYHLERLGDKIPATIHLRSPFDPKHNRVKGMYDK